MSASSNSSTVSDNKYCMPPPPIIADKWMVTIALIMEVKCSTLLSVICIKKGVVRIQNNSLWHLDTVNFFAKCSANHEKPV